MKLIASINTKVGWCLHKLFNPRLLFDCLCYDSIRSCAYHIIGLERLNNFPRRRFGERRIKLSGKDQKMKSARLFTVNLIKFFDFEASNGARRFFN